MVWLLDCNCRVYSTHDDTKLQWWCDYEIITVGYILPTMLQSYSDGVTFLYWIVTVGYILPTMLQSYSDGVTMRL